MREPKVPVAKEGIPFLGMSALATVVFALLQLKLPAIAGLLVTAFVLYFFRDPDRICPHGKGLIISPADGRVIDISECEDPYFSSGRARRISIFMSVFDCHVNRVPVAGKVLDVLYREGRFMAANRSRAMAENEQAALLLEDDYGKRMAVVQVAGLIARRIVCYAEVGDRLERGQRFGMIRFGSRLDVYLPLSASVRVARGQRVVAGQSIIARFD